MNTIQSQNSLPSNLKKEQQRLKEHFNGFAYDHAVHLDIKKGALSENFNFYRDEIQHFFIAYLKGDIDLEEFIQLKNTPRYAHQLLQPQKVQR